MICADPARRAYAGGVKRQITFPVFAFRASVRPYVVVTMNIPRT